MTIATITLPRLMMVGGGAHKEIVVSLKKLGVGKPLIVSDPYMAKSNILSKITDILDGSQIKWKSFVDTVPDPTTDVVGRGSKILRDGDFDSLIALGGGSPIDTAKAMAVLATHGGSMREYKVPNQVDETNYPIIAIPTTAGTGSEKR